MEVGRADRQKAKVNKQRVKMARRKHAGVEKQGCDWSQPEVSSFTYQVFKGLSVTS